MSKQNGVHIFGFIPNAHHLSTISICNFFPITQTFFRSVQLLKKRQCSSFKMGLSTIVTAVYKDYIVEQNNCQEPCDHRKSIFLCIPVLFPGDRHLPHRRTKKTISVNDKPHSQSTKAVILEFHCLISIKTYLL